MRLPKPLRRTGCFALAALLCLILSPGAGSASGPAGGEAPGSERQDPRPGTHVPPGSAPGPLGAGDPGFPVFLHADASFYANDLEYFTELSPGKTYFGADTSLYFTVERPSFDLSLGVFLKRDFGDEAGLSDVLPLFRFRYKIPWASFTLGFLDSRDNHGLPEALLAQQYPFRYPVEEGAQILVRAGSLRADAWINWYLLNTPEHREFFAAGLHASASRRFLSVELGFRVSHHGGQEFDVGLVTHNLSGMVRGVLSHRWQALQADYGLAFTMYAAGDYEKEALPDGRTKEVIGYGGEAECFFSPWGWRLYYRIFSGKDFIVEQGDPLYRTEKPLHRFGVRKTLAIQNLVQARLQFEGVMVESELDYNYLLAVDVSLDLFLHRFGGAAR